MSDNRERLCGCGARHDVHTDDTYTARLTFINSVEHDGVWDTITVLDADGETVETLAVESSETEAPYRAALEESGWIVVALVGDEWTLTR